MRTLALLLLLIPTLAQAQITVGDAIPPADVQTAQETIERAKPKVLKLNGGEFEIIEPAKTITVPLLWVPTASKLYETITIAANASHSHYGIRRGEKEKRLHKFLPVPYLRTILIASEKNQGQTIITVVKNGDKPDAPPVVIDTVDITVGTPAPDPPKPPTPGPVDPDPPVDPTDPLVAAAQADIKAGKGTADDVQAYANIFLMYSVQVKNAGTGTIADLYKDMNNSIDRLLGDGQDRTLGKLREAVRQELNSRIPKTGNVADAKDKISKEFADISHKLQGVK